MHTLLKQSDIYQPKNNSFNQQFDTVLSEAIHNQSLILVEGTSGICLSRVK